MNDSEKIKQLVDALGINVLNLTDKLMLSKGTLYHVVNGKNKLSYSLILKIIKAYPEVNMAFLERGELPILNENYINSNSDDSFILMKKSDITRMEQKIDEILNLLKKTL
jgi:hypothetical protein